ncbi:MAG: hypothetical protein IJU91_06025 [Selenomonadaceae bacterium]|nr:hypothetical protein [Selenomonadaceae bacterium]
MIHPETGEILRRDIRTIEFSFKGEKFTVDMPGRYPADNDNGIFSQEDLKIPGKVIKCIKARHKNFSRNDEFNFSNAAVI